MGALQMTVYTYTYTYVWYRIVEKVHRTSYEQNGVMLLQVSEDLFWLPKFSSVTNMLFELKLPTFNTLLHNYTG